MNSGCSTEVVDLAREQDDNVFGTQRLGDEQVEEMNILFLPAAWLMACPMCIYCISFAHLVMKDLEYRLQGVWQ